MVFGEFNRYLGKILHEKHNMMSSISSNKLSFDLDHAMQLLRATNDADFLKRLDDSIQLIVEVFRKYKYVHIIVYC